MTLDQFLHCLAAQTGHEARRSGGQYEAICPAHEDRKASLSVKEGDDGKILVKCFAGCETEDVVAALGLRMADLFPDRDGRPGSSCADRIVTTYDYRDESGNLLFQTVRLRDPKDFRQRRPDGLGGWVWNLDHTRRVLYRLPELWDADPTAWVFLPEGEKDSDRLVGLGLVVTCNPMGAGKWKDDYADALAARRCCILPDNDEPGRHHAETVAASLTRHGATEVKVLTLPGLPDKGDVSDWLNAGHTAAELLDLVEAAAAWTPAEPSPAVISGAAEPSQPPPEIPSPRTLSEAVQVFSKWLHLSDPYLLYTVWGTYAANMLQGDPVWLMVVAGPSTGKTEALLSLSCCPLVHVTSIITEAGLLSGVSRKERSRNATGGVLRKIGEHGVLILKDFGSILSGNRDQRSALLAALREIFDGHWQRDVGVDGGRSLEWIGKMGLLAGCTPAIDSHHQAMSTLGERFLLYRIGRNKEGDQKQAEAVLTRVGLEKTMREELAEATAGLLGNLSLPKPPYQLSPQNGERLVALASLVACCRSGVERDSHTREILYVPDSESPGRLVGGLALLYRGLQTMGLSEEDRWKVLVKVGRSSMPALRWRVFEALEKAEEPLSTSKLAEQTAHPTPTVRRAVEDLTGHGVVTRKAGGQGKADQWELTAWAREQYAKLPTFPEMSEREQNAPDDSSLTTHQHVPSDISGKVPSSQESSDFCAVSEGAADADAGKSDLLSLAASLGWPEVSLGLGVTVGPGERAWHTFAAKAKPEHQEQAVAALRERQAIEEGDPFVDDEADR